MLLLLLGARREAMQGLMPILLLQVVFRSFSFQKLKLAWEESAQESLAPAACVHYVFLGVPSRPPHCHMPFDTHTCLGTLLCLGSHLPLVRGERPGPLPGGSDPYSETSMPRGFTQVHLLCFRAKHTSLGL